MNLDEIKGSADTVDITSNKKVTLSSKNINLSSSNPSDFPVLFNQLNSLLTDLISYILSLTVTCSAPGATSTPPLNAAAFASLLQRLTTLKSKYIKID